MAEEAEEKEKAEGGGEKVEEKTTVKKQKTERPAQKPQSKAVLSSEDAQNPVLTIALMAVSGVVVGGVLCYFLMRILF